MDISSADFMKFTIQEAADLLADKLQENKEKDIMSSGLKFYGHVDGELCEIEMSLVEVDPDESVE